MADSFKPKRLTKTKRPSKEESDKAFWADIKQWLEEHPTVHKELVRIMKEYDVKCYKDILSDKIPPREKKKIIPFNRYFLERLGQCLGPLFI